MKKYRAIGLMSGTSMDGIDLAFIESDGKDYLKLINQKYQPYENNFKEKLFKLINNKQDLITIKSIENELTLLHCNIVNNFITQNNLSASAIDIIGFHGHTVCHNPRNSITWQIGNADLLAHKTSIDVVADFRIRDVTLGGNGAPLVPIYHFYLFKNFLQTSCETIGVLNIGGVSNITLFNINDENSLCGFDVCFGNAPLDDLVKEKINENFDYDGSLTASGFADINLANQILQNPLFHENFPRAFDRQDFVKILEPIKSLELKNALATYSYIIAHALKIALSKLAIQPQIIFVCGGGRKNFGLMSSLQNQFKNIEIINIDKLNIDGDFIEAQAFGFLAIRHLQNLAITFPNTTGIKQINGSQGGVLYRS
jgi:anhydro-N-acetylmuramic acid kinase